LYPSGTKICTTSAVNSDYVPHLVDQDLDRLMVEAPAIALEVQYR
jgi:hypothetical protein